VSKYKELSVVVNDLAASLLNAVEKLTKIHIDLYASIKEVAELRYRMVELELRLSNLEEMVKAIKETGGY
jgi:predicted ATP-grasp superfamily ATP-dependent carboligase